ncbi:nicotinate-nicotinamide nucleotide adenylyltransferase [Carboxydothermus islandicus]|uniref:Probable nicotinate-nucleotide adenylyltransferase n=1 Tax=Carboxydothermus islandicus TaxID=661089 RepID=A0A1L8D5H0_9THEO|nr:nicotinate-nucleotide adenylyltransferase [Carboxydothermus islandicus]GAV26412.1 nicotinate-nicotinamide nucleotide adenylyltransferase [Carboxydothermus islandicus]
MAGAKIGIFGGSFNPVHIGHLVLAREAYWQAKLDQVVFMPAKIPPHKKEGVINEQHRFQMLQLALKKYPEFSISDIEFLRDKPSYTFDTVEELKLIYPRDELYFITGADGLLEIAGWYRGEELLTKIPIIAVSRSGVSKEVFLNQVQNLKNRYRAQIIVVEMPEIGISSSLIRQRIRSNLPYSHLVPVEVYDYIVANNLYR